jgi:hypothetical protein
MRLTASHDVNCSAQAPAAARNWLRTLLTTWVPGHARESLTDDALLCATELITNAVEAGCRSATLRVTLDDQLRLSIIDDAAGIPTLTQPLPAAIRGRGLIIVEALSQRWGVDRSAAGKEVWAEFAVS